MKVVYHAENIIDANLVRSLLENDGLLAFVNGEYLAGAVGDVPATGLMSVAVADSDEQEARKIVAAFDAERQEIVAENETAPDPGQPGLAPAD